MNSKMTRLSLLLKDQAEEVSWVWYREAEGSRALDQLPYRLKPDGSEQLLFTDLCVLRAPAP